MVKLSLESAEFAPVTYADVTLVEQPFETLLSVQSLIAAPPRGYPKVGTYTDGTYWGGHRQWYLRDKPRPRRPKQVAVVDQSGGWRVFLLSGTGARGVLARLCQVDLRDDAFPVGAVARAETAHLMSLIARTEHGYELWFMRSYARNAHHHIVDAMKSVAAQT